MYKLKIFVEKKQLFVTFFQITVDKADKASYYEHIVIY